MSQLELPGPPTIEPGRYLIASPQLVVVVNEPGARPARTRRRLLRKPGPEQAGELGSEPGNRVTRLTAVRPEPLADGRSGAERWLERMRTDHDAAAAELAGGVRAMNRVLHAHREATLDPTLTDVAADRALIRRLGFASGDQAADGRWEQAIELPEAPDSSRREALRWRERVAALLGGRVSSQPAAGAVIHAREDFDAGRLGDAALQLELAIRALDPARGGARGGPGQPGAGPAELQALAPRIAAIAAEALDSGLPAEREPEIEAGLKLVERELRRERAGR
ncbi:MAG: hypothetical protein H0W09_01330 [Solirubrobacterales bacterium]|nr:hypothetical protein [Solirubrobacterales bacterium]